MAPQNSTLIHENAELASDLSRYSPILTIKEEGNDDHRRKSISSSEDINILQDDEVPIWICGEPRFISGLTSVTTCNDIIQALIDDEIHTNNNDVAASRDLNDYVITEKWRDVEQALEGEANILPIWLAWGSSRAEVKFKLKINKNRDSTKVDDGRKKKTKSKKTIDVSNLLKRLIEQGESIKEQLAVIRDKPQRNVRRKIHLHSETKSIIDTLPPHRILKCLEYTDEFSATTHFNQIETEHNEQQKLSLTDDELFLLIDNRPDADHSGVHVEYRQYLLNKKLNLALEAKKSKQIVINETPRRRLNRNRKEQNLTALKGNSLNKRLLNYLLLQDEKYKIDNGESLSTGKINQQSNSFDGIRYEIAIRMAELNQLILFEEDLMDRLTVKCEKYRNQNKIYTRKLQLEMCIEDVQRNLNIYAKDIINLEMQLYEIQHEIRQKCGILHNLQRMLHTDSDHSVLWDACTQNAQLKSNVKDRYAKSANEENSYVVDSFGPCDNSANKSIII